MSTSITIIVAVLQRLVGDDVQLNKVLADLQTEVIADEAAEKALEARVLALEEATPPAVFDPTAINDALSALTDRVGKLETAPPMAPDLTALTDRVTALEDRNTSDDSTAGALGSSSGPGDPTTIIPGPLSPATATVGEAYSAIITASGGVPPLQFSIASGALPDGLSLSAGGMVSGTPTVAGDFVFGIQVHDANNNVGQAIFTLSVAAAAVVVQDPAPEPVAPAVG